jgi:hypothetical protein
MVDKETIRPIYSELQGCLAQAPSDENRSYIDNAEFWEHYNTIIKELNELTGKDYNKYTLSSMRGSDSSFLFVSLYLLKIGGLIARLHAEYFKDEPVPFANMPSTIINQNQSQSVQIEFLLEVNNLINDKLKTAKEGSKEKSFLEKIKGSLSKVKSVSQLIPLIISTAKEMGISIDQLSDLF